jgi:hypothetical protein
MPVRIKRLRLCYRLGLSRRDDRDRGVGCLATLTCHFFGFQRAAFYVCALAIGVVQPCCKARLVFAIGLAALGQSCLMAAVFAAVALATITGAADIKHDAAFQLPTNSLAYLGFRQGNRAFPKAGLDNGRQSWQAMSD